MSRTITYSPSAAFLITHACSNRCLYCGFRDDTDDLTPMQAFERDAKKALRLGISEALILSGEKADHLPTIRQRLRALGFPSITAWTQEVCRLILGVGLLPHVNIGLLTYSEMKELGQVATSMGLMMEGDYGEQGKRIHPGKNFQARMDNLRWAGQLQIPFTTGILMGLGEGQADRVRSLEAIISVCKEYDHVQEIILQNFVQNRVSSIQPQVVSKNDLKEMVALCKENIPEVALQLPVNLNQDWPNLLDLGFDDLGGISPDNDLINPEHPWPPFREIEDVLSVKGFILEKRLPIYPKYYQKAWHSENVRPVIEAWLRKKDEYTLYYR